MPKPLSVYGVTKLEGEKRVTQTLDNAYIIRTAWVYSTFGKNFVKTIANLAKQRPELTVVADQVWITHVCEGSCGSDNDHRYVEC
ncbi:MAG: sugar nucleotide-binding protein [Bacteroidota bacterium]